MLTSSLKSSVINYFFLLYIFLLLGIKSGKYFSLCCFMFECRVLYITMTMCLFQWHENIVYIKSWNEQNIYFIADTDNQPHWILDELMIQHRLLYNNESSCFLCVLVTCTVYLHNIFTCCHNWWAVIGFVTFHNVWPLRLDLHMICEK